jgi:multisubunit Na+/H+ antiporter MnhB subunit
MSDTKHYSGGLGFTGLLTIVFITLKLLKVIDWSWVLSPVWISVALVLAIGLIMILFVVVREARK